MCDCESHTIDTSYIRLAASDLLIAKALKLSEVAQIARAEVRLRELLEAKWDKHAANATKQASTMARQGKSASQIAAAIRKEMQKWAEEITNTFNAEVAGVYRNARVAGYKKAHRTTAASLQYNTPSTAKVVKAKVEALPSFDVVDDAAVQSLEEHNTFWIGEHYDKNLSNSIRDTTRKTMVEAGASPAAAGKLMAQRVKDMLGKVVTPTGFIGTSKQYFEGLVANAMTVGRVYGQMRSFAEAGIRRYTIVNPGGSRMCEVCAHLQGKTFELEQGLKQIETELQIDDPKGIKKAHPWVSLKQLKEVSPNSGRLKGKAATSDSAALAKAGFSLPPYHFKCRCTVDIADDIKSYSELMPMSFPTRNVGTKPIVPPIPKPKLKPEDVILRNLLTGKMTEYHNIGKGVNGAKMATLETPDKKVVKAIWKPKSSEMSNLRPNIKAGTYHNREAAMYQLDKELGGANVVPPTVSRNPGVKEVGSLQHYVEGAKGMDDLHYSAMTRQVREAMIDDERMRKLFLLDIIGANDDRHMGNVMFKVIEKAGKTQYQAIAIDNGLTFPSGKPSRWIYAFDRDTKAHEAWAMLDKKSVTMVKRIKMDRLATICVENEIPEDAAVQAMVRTRALQLDPDIIKKQSKYSSSAAHDFLINSAGDPTSKGYWQQKALLPKAEYEKIKKIAKEVYKAHK